MKYLDERLIFAVAQDYFVSGPNRFASLVPIWHKGQLVDLDDFPNCGLVWWYVDEKVKHLASAGVLVTGVLEEALKKDLDDPFAMLYQVKPVSVCQLTSASAVQVVEVVDSSIDDLSGLINREDSIVTDYPVSSPLLVSWGNVVIGPFNVANSREAINLPRCHTFDILPALDGSEVFVKELADDSWPRNMGVASVDVSHGTRPPGHIDEPPVRVDYKVMFLEDFELLREEGERIVVKTDRQVLAELSKAFLTRKERQIFLGIFEKLRALSMEDDLQNIDVLSVLDRVGGTVMREEEALVQVSADLFQSGLLDNYFQSELSGRLIGARDEIRLELENELAKELELHRGKLELEKKELVEFKRKQEELLSNYNLQRQRLEEEAERRSEELDHAILKKEVKLDSKRGELQELQERLEKLEEIDGSSYSGNATNESIEAFGKAPGRVKGSPMESPEVSREGRVGELAGIDLKALTFEPNRDLVGQGRSRLMSQDSNSEEWVPLINVLHDCVRAAEVRGVVRRQSDDVIGDDGLAFEGRFAESGANSELAFLEQLEDIVEESQLMLPVQRVLQLHVSIKNTLCTVVSGYPGSGKTPLLCAYSLAVNGGRRRAVSVRLRRSATNQPQLQVRADLVEGLSSKLGLSIFMVEDVGLGELDSVYSLLCDTIDRAITLLRVTKESMMLYCRFILAVTSDLLYADCRAAESTFFRCNVVRFSVNAPDVLRRMSDLRPVFNEGSKGCVDYSEYYPQWSCQGTLSRLESRALLRICDATKRSWRPMTVLMIKDFAKYISNRGSQVGSAQALDWVVSHRLIPVMLSQGALPADFRALEAVLRDDGLLESVQMVKEFEDEAL